MGTLPGGTASFGAGVNDSGQVTGQAIVSGVDHIFLSGPNGGTLKDLGTLGLQGVGTGGSGVNASGQVVGTDFAPDGGYHSYAAHAFLSGPNGGTLKNLGILPGGSASTGQAVNDLGQIAGYGDTASRNGSHAFLSDMKGGRLTDLGTLGGNFSAGYGVNTGGQVTGESTTASDTDHAFLSYPNGALLTTANDLGTLSGETSSVGSGVNFDGQVAGYSDTASGNEHAFLSGPNGETLIDLGTLPGTNNSKSFGVNDSGQVIGYSFQTYHLGDAFLYSNGALLDLNKLIAPGSDFMLRKATSISNNGFITGFGINDLTGQSEAFLLTPVTSAVPEASSFASFNLLLSLGLAGLVVARRKRRA